MAKIRHNNIIDTATEVIAAARDKGIVHLYSQDLFLDKGHLTINGKETLHFGTCGYLGLEHEQALKDGAIKAINDYGTQFPMSKSYISHPLYTELEALIETMYQSPVVISKNCTLAHIATIPSIIRENDAVILDHLVHSSVQDPVQKLLTKGVRVEMVRHNNLEMLEYTIKNLGNKYRRIWYMADGVYSMYGDFAPIQELIALAEKYEQLYLYVDDAHGMSWAGQHGSGYIMGEIGKVHEKMILTTTLGKGFGACGGVTVFPNEEWRNKVKTFGGPLTFSVQLEPPILGAAVASARLHLSDRIYAKQEQLQKRIAYTNALINKTSLPMVAENHGPVFFMGMGAFEMASRFVQRLIDDGIYINLATFPAVPVKNNGARFTISLNNTLSDIEELVDRMDYHFNEALTEVDQTHDRIRRAFNMPVKLKESQEESVSQTLEDINLTVRVTDSVEKIDKEKWNQYLGREALFDWEGMKFMERVYKGNDLPENNLDFRYYTVTDQSGKVLVMTFCVIGLWKEDTFSKGSISRQLEERRRLEPYYLTSKAIIMGSMLTEGKHMYIDRTDINWKRGVSKFLEKLFIEQEATNASYVILRDFDTGDQELTDFMLEKGFVKVDMPESCVRENLTWNSEQEFRNTLSKRGRQHFKEEIKRFERYFDVAVAQKVSSKELEVIWNLFNQVKERNFDLNPFAPPKKILDEINEDENWEFLLLRLNCEGEENGKIVSAIMSHRNVENVYSCVLIGMDYEYVFKLNVYRQSLHQIVKRARLINASKVNFGISATTEKRKVGVTVYPKVAYVNAKDNFNMELINATMLAEQE